MEEWVSFHRSRSRPRLRPHPHPSPDPDPTLTPVPSHKTVIGVLGPTGTPESNDSREVGTDGEKTEFEYHWSSVRDSKCIESGKVGMPGSPTRPSGTQRLLAGPRDPAIHWPGFSKITLHVSGGLRCRVRGRETLTLGRGDNVGEAGGTDRTDGGLTRVTTDGALTPDTDGASPRVALTSDVVDPGSRDGTPRPR